MKILNLHVTKNLLIILFLAIGVLTFGMIGGQAMQFFAVMSAGVPTSAIFEALYYSVPMFLSYTMPMGILVSVLLLFGRMSADNEITAMRACGISIFQIISPLIVVTFVLTLFCLWLQMFVTPVFAGKARELLQTVAKKSPQALIVPGRAVRFQNQIIYTRDKVNNTTLEGVQIFVLDENGRQVKQALSAPIGEIYPSTEDGTVKISLKDYTLINYEGANAGEQIYGKKFTISYNINKGGQGLLSNEEFTPFDELLGRTILYRRLGLDTSECIVTLNMMVAMGLSPIAFLLIGLPLAIRTNRRETSIGLFLSVILAGVFYFFMIGAKSMYSNNAIHPEILLWIPNVLYQVGGFYMLYKISRK